MNLKSLIFPALAATAAGLLVHYYLPRIETKTVVQTKVVVQNDVRTITKIVERPDGSKETVTETVDRSTKDSTASKTELKMARKDWQISAQALASIKHLDAPEYAVNVQKRLLGPLYAGLLVANSGRVGISLGFEF